MEIFKSRAIIYKLCPNCENLDLRKVNGVYKIYHLDKPNLFYIGSCTSRQSGYKGGLYTRWLEHIRLLRKNTHDAKYLQNVYNKYGETNLRLELIENLSGYNSQYILKREQYYLDTLNVCNYKFGYNTLKIAGSRLGKKHSLYVRQEKMTKIKNIEVFNKNNISLGVYLTVPEIAIKFNLTNSMSKIYDALNNVKGRYSYKGYKFKQI